MKRAIFFGIFNFCFVISLLFAGCNKENNFDMHSSEEIETVETETTIDKEAKTVITWMAPYGVAQSDDEVYKRFNELLQQKGYDFYVEFLTPGNDLEGYTAVIYDAARSENEVDIFNTGYDYYSGLYGDMVRDGLCQDLTAYIEQADKENCFTINDELIWKSLSVEDKIYGITGYSSVIPSTDRCYYYVNRDIVEKYSIDFERLFSDSDYFWECIFKVEKGEKSNEGFAPYIRTGRGYLFDYPDDLMPYHGPIALSVDKYGTVSAVNVYEDIRVKNSIIFCNELWRQGYIVQDYSNNQVYTKDVLNNGNYFMLVSSEQWECDSALEYKKPFAANNRTGAVTCIASWSDNKQAAFELLCAVHTDRELSEMLAFGIEGVHYRVEGQKILKTNVEYTGRNAAVLLTNVDLLRESDYNFSSYIPNGLNEWDRERIGSSPLLGNPLDLRRIKEQMTELPTCAYEAFPVYLEDSTWNEQDLEQKYGEGLELLKSAGIDEILNEINHQLKDRGLQ